jgi:ribosomal protein L44E
MTQHYQRNTAGIYKFCPTCNRLTMHDVDDRRVGSCREVHVVGMSKKQLKEQKKKRELFNDPLLF